MMSVEGVSADVICRIQFIMVRLYILSPVAIGKEKVYLLAHDIFHWGRGGHSGRCGGEEAAEAGSGSGGDRGAEEHL